MECMNFAALTEEELMDVDGVTADFSLGIANL